MSIDLEDRLRAMYAAVADTTEVREELVPVDDDAPTAHRSIGRRRALALLAVAAVLLAGLVVVVTHHRRPTPAAPLKDRPFAVATWIPDGFGLSGTTQNTQPATGIHGFAGSPDRVGMSVYLGPNSHQIVVSTPVGGTVAPTTGTRAVTLESGAQAQLTRDTEFVTVAWVQPGGYAASVYAQGITDDDAVKIANSIWWVTEPMWQQLTAKAGFPHLELDTWHPPGDGDTLTFRMVGSMQRGFMLSNGPLGFGLGGSGATGCWSQWLARSDTDQQVVLRSFQHVDAFRVTLPDGTTRDVAAGMAPGLPGTSLATTVIDAPRSFLNGNVKVDCIEVEP